VNSANQEAIFKKLFPGGPPKLPTKFKYKVDDYVRLAAERAIFTKGFAQGWTEEIFQITTVLRTSPTRYRVKDKADEIIGGIHIRGRVSVLLVRTFF
jgi:hypothetical protein